ncbi:lysophospholipid acyltransferase family protein [bacterium]|nr:lysophospholipid acyltransferase family protein [bacterium]
MRSNFSYRVQYWALLALGASFRLLPRRIRSAVGGCLGQVVYLIGIRVRVTEQNLMRAFPSLPRNAIRMTVRRVYCHFGRVAASFATVLTLRRSDLGKWIFVEGTDVLDEAVRSGKGGLVFSGHLGNWELMGAICAQLGYPVTFVVASQSNPYVEELIDRYRQRTGIEIIKRRDAIRGVLTALKRGRLVAMLIDQDAHEEGTFVPFFGTPASTPRGPAVFHLRTGAPLIFAHSARLPGDRYRIQVSRLDTAGCADTDEITARMSSVFEAAVRKTPEQWFWMHRRWKTRLPESSL